ncbi:MAG: glycosyltransferase family 4 protein [Alphaproteobacteria bacterium]|nr:glycosyltransferase family 4 protein [Alphaproteobacteria bacterium]
MALTLLLIAAAAFVISCCGTRALIPLLRRRALLDRPNERSSHVCPTPRGGGVALVGAVGVCWLALWAEGAAPAAHLAIVASMAGLAAVSWVDDVGGLSPPARLAAQFVAVGVGMLVLPPGPVFQGWLPPGLDAVAAALLWVWFANLFNFMDGIDGIAASEAAAVGLGLLLIGGAAEAGPAAAILGAALGFLIWNWAPARIFMGDVGSVPLGYALAFLLYELALRGDRAAALILPLYFLADATLTLLWRLARGERVWQAHRQHFYQRAVQRGLGHDTVVLCVIATDLVLIGCAWAVVSGWSVAGLAVAALTVALLLVALGTAKRGA